MILYKYLNPSIFKKGIYKSLLAGNIKLTHPESFNDPLDSLFHYSTPYDSFALKLFASYLSTKTGVDEKLSEFAILCFCENARGKRNSPPYFSDMYNVMRFEFKDDFRQIINSLKENHELRSYISTFDAFYESLGIVCLSERNNSVSMWAYYTNHEGICVEYDVDEELLIRQKLKLAPVRYGMNPFVENTSGATSDKELLDFISNKSIDWSHEKENRIYGFALPEIINFPGKITRMCTGLRMKQSHRKLLIKESKKYNVPIYQAVTNHASKTIEWLF